MDFKEYLSRSSSSPKKVLKIVLSISAVLLLMWLFMISRMEFTNTDPYAGNPVAERADSAQVAAQANRLPDRAPASDRDRSPNIFLNAFTTVIVMFGLFGLVWFFTRKKGEYASGKKLKELGEHALGQGAFLKIVEINNEVWVIGTTSGNVQLLHRYQKEDWKESLSATDNPDKSFYDILKSKTRTEP